MLEVFGVEGLIARAHPEYEYRPGQVEMARAVMRAFEDQRHLIVEAGTGTGKTLAYLVPAVAAALGGRGRVIEPVRDEGQPEVRKNDEAEEEYAEDEQPTNQQFHLESEEMPLTKPAGPGSLSLAVQFLRVERVCG